MYRRPIARREHGLNTVQFAQSHARMTVASEGLHSATSRSVSAIPATRTSTRTSPKRSR